MRHCVFSRLSVGNHTVLQCYTITPHTHTHTAWHHLLLFILLKSAAGCMNAAIVHQEELDNSQTFPIPVPLFSSFMMFMSEICLNCGFTRWQHRWIHRSALWSVVKNRLIEQSLVLCSSPARNGLLLSNLSWPRGSQVFTSTFQWTTYEADHLFPVFEHTVSTHLFKNSKEKKEEKFFQVLFLGFQKLFWFWISNCEQLYSSLLCTFCIFP